MQNKNTKIQIFIILLFLSFNSLAQTNIKFEYISLAEGLSQSSVLDIHRDKDGYMWFATFDGLNKFDGYKIEVFRTNPTDSTTISDNSITCIYESKENEIWIGHKKGGISVYNKFTNKFYSYKHNKDDKNSLVDDDVKTIEGDKDGNVWVGTTNGLSKISPVKTDNTKGELLRDFTNLIFSISNPYTINSNEINKIVCGNNSNLWLATSAGICQLDINTLKAKNLKLGKELEGNFFYNVSDILLQSDSLLWIATDKGLGKFLLKEKRLVAYTNIEEDEKSLSNDEVSSLALDNDGSLWIGTKNGLNHYIPKQDNFEVIKSSVFNLTGLNSSEILSLFIDNESILWVGTSLGGVNKWNRPAKQFRVIKNIPFDKTSLSSNKIRAFFQDKDSNIWVGTVDAGLDFWDKNNNTFRNFKPSPSLKSISDLHIRTAAQDQQGRLWFGTNDHGIDLYNINNKDFTSFNVENSNLTNNTIWALLVDTKNRLWVGTLGGGLCVTNLNEFDGKNLEFKNYSPSNKNSISDLKISCIIEDRDSNIWIGTRYEGLNRLDKNLKTFKNYKFLDENNKTQTVDRVYSILEDSQGTIWVGTRGSLNKYNSKTDKFKKYDYLEYGFPNPVMMGIVEDDKQNIWVSTNRGLACFNINSETSRNYDVTDGLQSNEFMMGAYIKTFDNQIMFGGQTGFNAFYPNDIKDNPHKPEVLLTNFLLFNKTVDLDTCVSEKAEINLNHNQNTFTFEFVGLDYVNSLQNKYAYKLEGFDDDWQKVGTRKFASYTNIAAGDYTFKVIAANNDGIWNTEGKSIRINIKPPFWKTTWFGIFFLVIVIVLAYFLLHLRDVYRDKNELEVKVVVRTKEVVKQKEDILEKNEELKQQQEEILAQRDALQEQKDISEERRIAITDSITYAERIQRAILPPSEIIEKILPDHFILFKPRDIVSGDYYWMRNKNNKLIITAADCTGHGVPGAFLSMLGVSFLNEIIAKKEILIASEILESLRAKLIESLHQTGKTDEAKDGMDLALCVIDPEKMELQYSGAYNPLFLFRLNEDVENGRELIEIKGDRMPVGISDKGEKTFTNHVVKVKKDDAVYMFSDGYPDQFGGSQNKKFMIKTFRALLLKNFDKPMIEQQTILNQTLKDWQLNYEQIDDILVMGIRI